MVLISEWLPNPEGADDGAEWFELRNDGAAAVDLAGWHCVAGAKRAELKGTLSPGGYAVFPAKPLGLSLKNIDGALELFDASGRIADKASFLGSAPSGKSFALIGGRFRFAPPTPGAASPETAIVETTYPLGVPLHPAASGAVGGALLVGLAAALVVGYIIHANHDLHDLLFPGHETPGSASGADAP
jgi:hypothetical protein